MADDDLYGDLIHSSGEAGSGLLRGQVGASLHTYVMFSDQSRACAPYSVQRALFMFQVAELLERSAARESEIVTLSARVQQLTQEVRQAQVQTLRTLDKQA